jgi:hypothetical protein
MLFMENFLILLSCWNSDSNKLAVIHQPHGVGTFPVVVSDVERFVRKMVMLSDVWVDLGMM